ncbi:hypothetical protein Chor_002506, partial [Crotalus horridus]
CNRSALVHPNNASQKIKLRPSCVLEAATETEAKMSALKHPEYPEAKLLQLEGMIPCRETQASTLLSIFGERQHFSFPALFIYGHTSSGKTYVVQTLLKILELPHVFVNCAECFTSRLLLEEILRQLQCLFIEEGNPSFASCDTFNDFVRLFKKAALTPDLQNQTIYVVLDKAEHLRELEGNILPGFLRLQELYGKQCGHLQKILSHDHPPEYSFDFYAAYINILLGVFYPVCRDLKELQHLVRDLFANERDTRRLWKNIESHLKKAMQTVYLREISSSQWERLQQDNGEPGQVKGLSAHAHVELPYYSKFLLIAAYLASYNPARTDKRFFVKTSNHLLGPKPFPLDRLLAILYSIVDSRIPPTANIFSQVSETALCLEP